MTGSALTFSDDQAGAWDAIAAALKGAGVDLDDEILTPLAEGRETVLAVLGKAGSGKTMLLAELCKRLRDMDVEIVSGDWESRRRKDRRSLAILAPTNKAA